MSINFKSTGNLNVIAGFLANELLRELEKGKRVLWFVTGGSSIAVASLVSKILAQFPYENLTVMLTDERYGQPGHKDSNWQQLLDRGFVLPHATLIPILDGGTREDTTAKYNEKLWEEFAKAEYKIGLFGAGTNSHTAGIMPESGAVDSKELAYSYEGEDFERITITAKAITQLDEAVLFTQGDAKWPVVKKLRENIPVAEEPVQILKKVPLLTVFTDHVLDWQQE